MKKKFIMIITTIVVCLVFVVTMSYAWFTESNTKKTTIDGSTPTAYYKSGDGTKDNPYVIARPVHLYNFAWLQYMGTYNKLDSDGNLIPTYFKIESDETDENGNAVLDMSNTNYSILPPIGTEANPFVGNFDGNNTIIKGLTTSSNDFKLKPASVKDYTEPHILGFFGYVGQASSTITGYDSSINTISNLYIDDYTVKNTSNSPDVLVGLLAGYANAQINNSGVLTAQFDLVSGTTKYSSYTKISKYSLIGDYNEKNFNWAGKPSGGSGDDVGYGTSTDIRQLYYDLGGSDGTSSIEVSGKQALPFRPDSNDEEIKDASQKTATVNLSANTTGAVNLASNQQAAKNNIGYYVGNSVKAFRDSSVTSLTITSPSYFYSYFSTDVPTEVTSFLNKEVTDKSGNTSYNYQYSIFISDSTQTALDTGYSNANNLNLVENAIVNDFSCGSYEDSQGKLLLVPNRCIWVAPKQAGKFKMVVYNIESSMCQLAIYRLIRSTPKDYSTYFTSATKFLISNGTETSGNDANITIPKSNSKTALQAYYYAFDVSEADVKAGYEFAITQNSGKPYIAYLDIGNNGADSGDDDDDKSPIDFAYFNSKNVLVPLQTKTTDTDGNVTYSNNSSYVYSKAFFEVDGTSTGTLKVQFKRTLSSGTTETITLTYYFTPNIGITTTPNNKDVVTQSSDPIISGS